MVRIITDRAADIEKEVALRLGIEILPFSLSIGGEELTADINMSAQDFYNKLKEREGEYPKTGQMSPLDLEDIFRKYDKEDQIIYISISAKGSGINATANMVASQLRDEGCDITVVDSKMYAMALGRPVIEAAEMAKRGAGKEEIIAYVEECFSRDTAYFIVDDLTFLQKGGRIKPTAMAISKILDIKPILMVTDGLVEAYKKVRGMKKAMSVLVGYVLERMDEPEKNEIVILHTDAPDKAEQLRGMLEEKVKPGSISASEVGPIITAHTGLGLIGLYFKHKKPYTEYDK